MNKYKLYFSLNISAIIKLSNKTNQHVLGKEVKLWPGK